MDDYLEHYGVKGMRWGHRRERREARLDRSRYATVDFKHSDKVYRILADEGNRPLSDIAYVSTNDLDNTRYIHILNHTIAARLIKGARYNTQLVLGPTTQLRAPSLKRAEIEINKLATTNPVVKKFVKDNELYFGVNPTPRHLNQILNTAFVDDDRLFDGAVAMRAEVKNHFKKLGYNSLLDQNDMREGLAKTPLVVFDPEKTLRVVSKTKIDEVIKTSATKTYKQMQKEAYTDN